MKFPKKLTYKEGIAQYYHVSTAKEGSIKAEVLIVPGKLLDMHMQNNTALPLMACAIYKDHPDHPFNADPKMRGKNIILIRDQVYKLADKKEMQSLVEHEFGHIVHGHVTQSVTHYDMDEVLADVFMEQPEHMKSLEKKWACCVEKYCKKCKAKMIIDNDAVKDHWFLYCPSCGYWLGDGMLSMFYIDRLVCERVGKQPKEVPESLQFLAERPILSYDQNEVISKIIAEGKKVDRWKGVKL